MDPMADFLAGADLLYKHDSLGSCAGMQRAQYMPCSDAVDLPDLMGFCDSPGTYDLQLPALLPSTSADSSDLQALLPCKEEPCPSEDGYAALPLAAAASPCSSDCDVQGARRCTNCGATDTPRWRNTASHGMLCNACGLHLRSKGEMRKRPASSCGPPAKRSKGNSLTVSLNISVQLSHAADLMGIVNRWSMEHSIDTQTSLSKE